MLQSVTLSTGMLSLRQARSTDPQYGLVWMMTVRLSLSPETVNFP